MSRTEKRKTSLTIMTEYVRYMFVYMALSGFHSLIINDIRCAKEQSRKQINCETNFLIFVAKKIICFFSTTSAASATLPHNKTSNYSI